MVAVCTAVFLLFAYHFFGTNTKRRNRQTRVTSLVGGVEVYTLLLEDGSFCIGCEVKKAERTANFSLQNQSVVEDEWIRTAARKIFQNSFQYITFNGEILEARMQPQIMSSIPKQKMQAYLRAAMPALAEIRHAIY